MTSPTILLLATTLAMSTNDNTVLESIQGPPITAKTALGAKRFAFQSWAFDFICATDAADPHSVVVSIESTAASKASQKSEAPELLLGKESGKSLPMRVWVQDYGPAGATRTQPPDPADDANWRGTSGKDPYWLVVLPRSWIANPEVAGGTFFGRQLSQADGLWRTSDVLPHLAVDLAEATSSDEYTCTLVFEVRTSKGTQLPFKFRGEGNYERDASGFSRLCMALKCLVTLRVSALQEAPSGETPTAQTPQKSSPQAPAGTNEQPEIKITAPSDGALTSDRVITVSGTSKGLPSGTRLEIWCATDIAYRQPPAQVSFDGAWSSSAVLGGHTHNIYARATVGGKTVRSQTVRITKD